MDAQFEMANYLENATFGTVGTDIFVGIMPADTDGIYLTRLGGDMNNYLPVEQPIIDIYTVYTSAETAIQKLEDIKRYMHRMVDTETSNSVIYSVLALGDVEQISRDTEYNQVYKQSFVVTLRATSLIS